MTDCQAAVYLPITKDVWPQGDVSSHQLAAILEKESCGVYAGFDPTASSLHVGNLLILVRHERNRRKAQLSLDIRWDFYTSNVLDTAQ